MNKHLYRIIFNRKRGQLMAVAETATGSGKGTGTAAGERLAVAPCLATLRPLAFALFAAMGLAMFVSPSADAQIVAYKAAPARQQATVLSAGNGVPLVNIQTPSAAGVSRNTYSQFDVQQQGVILNNAHTNAKTQLGGWVQGNPWLAGGTARVILNEVVSANPSLLGGYVEVAGNSAQVVIANPAGVTCSGCGFINASRATLTTGTPIINGGNLEGYRVQGGTVRIDGAGLDASQVGYTDFIARAVEVNAGLWAQTLKVTAGTNQVSADHTQATPVAGAGAAPAFAIDVSQLGGMYAGKITLIGTEAGVGVRNAGALAASAGEVVVTADGQLTNRGTVISGDNPLIVSARGIDNSGTLSSERNLTLSSRGSQGDVVNTGLMHAGRELVLDAAGQLSNQQGTLDGQRLEIHADSLANDNGTFRQTGAQALALTAGHVANSAVALIGNVASSGTGTGSGSGGSTSPAPGGTVTAPTTSGDGAVTVAPSPPSSSSTQIQLADGLIAVRGEIANTGTVAASGAVSLTASDGLANAGTLTLDRLTVTGESVRNSGTVTAADARLDTALLDNSGGKLEVARTLDLAVRDLVNERGTLRHTGANALALEVEGRLDNSDGQIASNATDLTLSAATVDNAGGRIAHAGNGALTLTADLLDGDNGQIESRGQLTLTVGEASLDGASTLGNTFDLTADTLTNQGGRIAQTGQGASRITVADRFDNRGGTVTNTAHLSVTAGELDNRSSGEIVSNGNLAVTTTAGDLTNDGGTVSSQGRLTANVAGDLGNAAGQLVAGTDLALTTDGGVDNTGGTLGAVAGRVDATLGGVLDNTGGRLEAATNLALSSHGLTNVDGTVLGQSLTVDTHQQAFNNQRGRLIAGESLTVQSGALTNTSGLLQATGALAIDTHGQALVNTASGADGGIRGQGTVQLAAGSIDNSSGLIAATGNLQLTGAALDNAQGRISTEQTLQAAMAGRFDNTGGTLSSAASLALTAGEVDNRNGGQIVSNDALSLTVTTGSLANDGGTVSSQTQLTANVAGELTNAAGQFVAGTDLALTTGGGVDNTGGTLGAVAGRVDASLGGVLDNTGGRVEAATDLVLSSHGLTNVDGTVLGQSLTVDTQQQALDNTRGTLAADDALAVHSGALTNANGRIQASGALAIDTHGQALINTGTASIGGILGQSTVTLATGALDNSSGLIASADALSATTGSLTNAAGRLSAQKRMTLTVGTTLDNQSGDIQAGSELNATATTAINNTGGLMRAGHTLTIGTASLVNAGTKATDKGIEGRSVDITAYEIDNRNSALRADVSLFIRSAGTLDNTNGLISSEQTLAVTDGSPVRTLTVTNTGGTLVAGTDLAVRAKRLTGDGQILSHGDLTVDLTADFLNTGEVTATNNASVTTAGVLTNSGTLQAGDTLTVQAGTLDNTASGKLTADTLNLKATDTHTLTNRGLIDGGDTFINAITLNNLGTGRIYGDHLAISATTLNNLAEGGAAPVIAARNRLDIGAGTLNNRDGALIFSAGDMSLGGALDASHRATGRASAITNSSAAIEALGNLAIDTSSLVNQKTTFATTRVRTTEAPSGTALLDHVPDLEFHWPISESSATTWRDYIRDRYLNVVAKLLGGGPDAALVEVYNIEQTLPDTPSPITRRDAFVNVWGNLKGYTGPEGGGLSSAYRSRLIAAVNARSASSLDDSHEIWQIIVDTIAAEHPEYIDQMAKTLAAQGTLQRTYSQTCLDPTDDCSYVTNSVSTHTTYRDVVSADSPAAVIRAGGDASINATALENRYSFIQSGGDMALTGSTLTNIGAEFYLLTDTTTTRRVWHWVSRDHGATTSASSTQALIGSAPAIISAGGTLTGDFTGRIDNITVRQNAAPVVGQKGAKPETTGTGSVGSSAAGAGTVQATAGSVGSTARTASTSAADTASAFGTAPGAITQVTAAGNATGPAAVVATTAPGLTLPANSLMHVNPDIAGRPLVETDPTFTSYRQWLASDYMLRALSIDPATTQKRLGDGFYEQRLVTEQIAQLTGRRFLDGYTDDETQYRALMDAGITVASEWHLVPGIALSEAQMAQLTTDIVWLVERTVTLADGTVQKVLVPQVYARIREGDLTPAGALLAAEDIELDTAGDLTTSGTIAGRQVVALTAENIANLRGRIAGRDLAVQAENDLAVLGGTVEAERTLIATAGRDLTVASTTVDRSYRPSEGAAVNAAVQKTVIDRVAGLYVTGDSATGTGGTLIAAAGNDLKLLAAALVNTAPTTASDTATAGTTLITAKHDLILGTVTETNDASTRTKKTRWHETSTTEVGSTLVTDGDLSLSAGHDLTARTANVAAGGGLTAAAGHDLTIATGESTYTSEYYRKSKSSGLLSSKKSERRDTVATTTALASSFSGDSVALTAGNDLTVKGSTVTAAGDLALAATRDIVIDTAQDTRHETHFRKESRSGFSASLTSGISYGKSSLKENADGSTVIQVASTLSGENVALTSGRDTVIRAGNVLADEDITILAGRNVDILAAADTQDTQSQYKSSSTSIGLLGGLSARTTLFAKADASQNGESRMSSARTSLLSANTGDLTVRAGLDAQYKGTGAGNLTTQGADLLAGDAITLSGNAIDLQAVANASSSHSVAKSKSVTVGAALAGGLGSQITAISDAVERAQNTDNDRLQGALVLKAGYDAYKLGQGQETAKTVPAGTDPNAPASTATTPATPSTVPGAGSGFASSGLGVSASIGVSKSKSESSTQDIQVSGTNLQARRIDIEATETDVHMAAAKLQAENIALAAKRDILLEAAANQSEIHSSNKNSSAGVGVTFAFGGQQNGVSFQLNASQATGKANGSETTWDNTLITASDTLSVRSGRDTTLKGAQLAGKAVDLDVGRDLLIETLQDVSHYASKQSSSGFSLSLCIPPICGGTMVTGSVSASNQKIKHAYQSAVGQSGIAAGEGGFDITVGNHTELVGAAITSTAEADQNRFSTASLSSRDLTNTQETQASSSSAGFSYGGGSALTTVVGNTTSNLLANLGNNAALPENGSESSTTQSVISPATITITGTGNKETDAASQTTADELTSRDPKTANGSLTNTLTLQQAQVLEQEIQRNKENQEAANLVGAVLSNVVGDVAAAMRKPVNDATLRQELDAKQADGKALTPAESKELARLDQEGMTSAKAQTTLADPAALADHATWQDGSLAKTALHGIVGLIEAKIGDGSATAGALGAISQEVMTPILSDYLVDQGYAVGSEEYKSLMQLGATLAGTAVGTLATGDVKGASTGANTAFVGVTNNYLSHDQKEARDKALAKCKTETECQGIRDTYQEISDQQDQLALYAIERARNCVGTVECAYAESELAAINKEILGAKVNGEVLPSMRDRWAAAAAALQEVERRYTSAACDASPACSNARIAGALVAGVGAAGGLYKLATFCATQPAVCNSVGIQIAELAGADALPSGIGVATATATGVKVVASEVKAARATTLTTQLSQDIGSTIKAIGNGSDNLLSTSVSSSAGDLKILAEVKVTGTQLQLDSFTVYGAEGDITKSSILKDVLSAKSSLVQAAKENGFTEIRIIAERVANSSSANPGKKIDLIIPIK